VSQHEQDQLTGGIPEESEMEVPYDTESKKDVTEKGLSDNE
jgi:hypothetical protein